MIAYVYFVSRQWVWKVRHYNLQFFGADANGHGWWDYDMEGVDNEQLGSNEVWEGVGSTTLGGIIDWH